MKKIRDISGLLCFVVFFLGALTSCGGGGSSAAPPKLIVQPPSQPTLQESLDNFLETNYQDNEPGMAILVVDKGKVIYSRGKGAANLNSGNQINPQTGFRLASVSKPITALAVMQLYQEARLNLDDSVLVFLPQLPASWQAITIHHLLTHQSGIKDYERGDWEIGQTNQDILDYYTRNDALVFQPGTDKEYSNPGYHLLAEIIEQVSGQRFEDYVQQHIFDALSMSDSYVADELSVIRANDALNFAQHETFFGIRNYINGANGAVSSLNDLHKLGQGILNHQLITEQTLTLMLQHHTKNLFGVNHYGYGFGVTESPTPIFFHSGRFDGFATYFYTDAANDRQIVFLGNGGDDTVNHTYLYELIVGFL